MAYPAASATAYDKPQLTTLAPLDPASGTVTIPTAASTDPNVDYPTASPARATAGSKVTAPTGAAARTESTLSSAWADDDARSAASTAATAPSSCSASYSTAALGRSSGAHDQGEAK